MEWPRLKGTSGGHAPIPMLKQDWTEQVAQVHVQVTFEYLWEMRHTSLGYPSHRSVTFRLMKHFLTFRQNLPCSSLLLLASCIITGLDWKELGCRIFELSHQVSIDIDKTPGEFFCPRLYSSNYVSLSS